VSTFQDWLALVGFILTILGFGLTFWQLYRTKRVAEATQDTVYRATDRVRYNQLLVLLPQLQNLEPELDNAVREDDGRIAARTLVRWNQLASQVEGILSTMGDEYVELAQNLKEACESAATAKGELVDEISLVKDVTRDVRKSISSLLVALGGILGSIATQASAPVETSPSSENAAPSKGKK
jgi:hypothetical protein